MRVREVSALLLFGCSSGTLPVDAQAGPSVAASGPADRALFDRTFSDGKAEVSGYDLFMPRYGELRHGRAVAIFVTEPYSKSSNVKVDHFEASNPDHQIVLKLNLVRKFQTGVYDYSLLTSVFADPDAGFRPHEVSFSSQEWCGHVYEETVATPTGWKVRTESYFEGETKTAEVEGLDVLPEDALLIRLRGLRSATLPTKGGPLRLLSSATQRRLLHRPALAYETDLSYSETTRDVTVPAGTFATRTATYKRENGKSCGFDLEVSYPHRIIGWSCEDGEVAKLTGTERIPYWNLNGEGQEQGLGGLGLGVPKLSP